MSGEYYVLSLCDYRTLLVDVIRGYSESNNQQISGLVFTESDFLYPTYRLYLLLIRET